MYVLRSTPNGQSSRACDDQKDKLAVVSAQLPALSCTPTAQSRYRHDRRRCSCSLQCRHVAIFGKVRDTHVQGTQVQFRSGSSLGNG